MNRKSIVLLVIVVILIIIFFSFGKKTEVILEEPLVSSTTPEVTASSNSSDYSIVADEEAKDPRGLSLLDRTIPQTSLNNKGQIEKLEASLKVNTNNYNQWVELGVYRKEANDFEGAVLVWEYASTLSPTNKIAYINLGNIYQYFIKDYPKAEINFKKAIEKEPSFVSSYVRLFDLYSQSYEQNTSKARDVLILGISKNPSSTELWIDLALYYKGKGDIQNYNKALSDARSIALKAGDSSAVSEINSMLKNF